ncbi:MAG: hypothetical protein ACK4N5_03745 [Myxococcales bacterium]
MTLQSCSRRIAVLPLLLVLSGCAAVSSDGGGFWACPPVVEYGREFQARAADELILLPDDSAIAEMLSDYSVMRNQAKACL